VTTYRLVGMCGSSVGRVSEDETLTCSHCGAQAPVVEALSWTTAVERGRQQRFCVSCSRENLRAMEGKLDSEWW
jgi:DNA-directed RNA polymerase subunit RPC12/RpoP